MKIYLLNKTPFEGVENLVLNELVFYDFNVDLNEYDALICTSKNALKALKKANIALNLKLDLYTVGQSSADFAKDLGFKKIKFPQKAYGKNLFNEFKDELKTKKCLYLRAKHIVSALNLDLKNAGINLDEKIVYENVFKKSDKVLNHPAIFIFTSPLGVENFLKFYTLSTQDKAIAIGHTTAQRLLKFKNLFICEKQSLQACVKLAKSLL
ncbi:uroporphyrinogen-III synthase [Campylobacter sp. VicNov18]|uniref:uroporphyrinogen-III synthase n=1 Tax=Campylobacter bilis TaxID=2691918 RepID=UPI00130EA58F|nr:uroporphyrinogen-III synthase [Campylobacter bilis]MPV63675.1 uroporphyrinogen-III synthase [Campylobacter hepaticus]MBM0637176.1 uroporphyrinogen-III synthase [Campylobacter bilis]MCC8277892.1 uroporphyrinogen-III synthase [Campylobacter bilis]MCC8298823.1 uroporphyrinogen-III synthase [Campylobacter bilis]MCC8300802.1 uroporphyrinogen-III synthase [Campylobacter bilis]